ncbi:hypothetical protein BK658_07830 [Pseudomonas brassicacearum]|uniref:Uncharacterized protein n=1 Tax=Pseudomonas brassicacearum TaxID=930166 RepID=A0A423GUH8_9PSED|nr:hypothetical protein BK658_07830 [Pseudomonas brassicacearum]
MDLPAMDTCVPAVTARGAIVEKGQKRRKAIGDYLNNHHSMIVPTLRVGTPPWTLCVRLRVTRSVTGCIPTQSVGTIS